MRVEQVTTPAIQIQERLFPLKENVMFKTATNVEWYGSPITAYQICGLPIGRRFIDGATKAGSWAIMCPPCFDTYGIGLGTGKGQCYYEGGITVEELMAAIAALPPVEREKVLAVYDKK